MASAAWSNGQVAFRFTVRAKSPSPSRQWVAEADSIGVRLICVAKVSNADIQSISTNCGPPNRRWLRAESKSLIPPSFRGLNRTKDVLHAHLAPQTMIRTEQGSLLRASLGQPRDHLNSVAAPWDRTPARRDRRAG